MAKSRSEIDKEMMYRKIMPSAAKKGNVVDGADESAVTMEAGSCRSYGKYASVPTAAKYGEGYSPASCFMPVR